MKVAQVMNQPVKTCLAEDTLDTAARIMWEHDCGCVPVVDGDGSVMAMITDRDICMAAYTKGGPLHTVQVKEAMSKTVCTCTPQDSLADAERIMRTNRVHRLPVVDAGNRVVGILSLNDLAQEASRDGVVKKQEINPAEIGETLGAICKPWGSRAIVVAH